MKDIPFKIIEKKKFFSGKIFDVSKYKIKIGKNYIFRDVVVHNGSVAIVPILSDGRIILIRQLRVPANKYLWEIPAGTLEKGEKPLQCAKRELLEETKCPAFSGRPKFVRITSIFTCPGFCTERITIYAAFAKKHFSRNDSLSNLPHDEDELIEVRCFRKDAILRMIENGSIIDSKSIVGLLLTFKKFKL